jgi:hypothetical protein
MHAVQTLMLQTFPWNRARTFCKLGCQVLLVLLFAWLTLFPTDRPLPQIEHVRAMITPFESFR